MNIVITLPQQLITKILLGEKRYEIRKSLPKLLHLQKSWVYVVEKGTSEVTLAFKVNNILYGNMYSELWRSMHGKAGIPIEWYNRYVRNAKRIYIWSISERIYFKDPVDVKKDLLIEKNPQQYSYTPIDIEYCKENHDHRIFSNFRNTCSRQNFIGAPETIKKEANSTPNVPPQKGGTVVPPSDFQSVATQSADTTSVMRKTPRPRASAQAHPREDTPTAQLKK